MEQIVCRTTDSQATLRFRALRGMGDRVVGLLGTDEGAEPVALCGCSSIHTWGMRYALDVALVSRNGLVLKSCKNVVPHRLLVAPGAYYALERPTSEDPWPSAGSWIAIANASTEVAAECVAQGM